MPIVRSAPVLAIIVASYLMIVLDISIVITGLPKIQAAFGFTPTGLSWVHSAYTLAFGSLLLLGARPATSSAAAACTSWGWRCSPLRRS